MQELKELKERVQEMQEARGGPTGEDRQKDQQELSSKHITCYAVDFSRFLEYPRKLGHGPTNAEAEYDAFLPIYDQPLIVWWLWWRYGR